MATKQRKINCITLKGSSAQIIVEYLKYGINSILFHRGIFPSLTFVYTQQYGLTILMSKKVDEWLEPMLQCTKECLAKNMLKKIRVDIRNVHTKKVVERWEFQIQVVLGPSYTRDVINLDSNNKLNRIQSEIRDVMRQISATVSYLPLLDCICSFQLLVHPLPNCDISAGWNNMIPSWHFIPNAKLIQMHLFYIELQKVNTKGICGMST